MPATIRTTPTTAKITTVVPFLKYSESLAADDVKAAANIDIRRQIESNTAKNFFI